MVSIQSSPIKKENIIDNVNAPLKLETFHEMNDIAYQLLEKKEVI